MKRIFGVLFALVVVGTLIFLTSTTSKHGERAVYAQSGCSVATLMGNYALSSPGFINPRGSAQAPAVPFAAVGVAAFDGAGNISATSTFAFNGLILTDRASSGTYTVNPDCTGSISLTAGVTGTFNMVIIGGGTEVFGIVTDPGETTTFDAKKQ